MVITLRAIHASSRSSEVATPLRCSHGSVRAVCLHVHAHLHARHRLARRHPSSWPARTLALRRYLPDPLVSRQGFSSSRPSMLIGRSTTPTSNSLISILKEQPQIDSRFMTPGRVSPSLSTQFARQVALPPLREVSLVGTGTLSDSTRNFHISRRMSEWALSPWSLLPKRGRPRTIHASFRFPGVSTFTYPREGTSKCLRMHKPASTSRQTPRCLRPRSPRQTVSIHFVKLLLLSA